MVAQPDLSLVTTAPAASPVPWVMACAKAGRVICGGSDGVRDSWSPYGMCDMLERAMLVGLRNNFCCDEEVECRLMPAHVAARK